MTDHADDLDKMFAKLEAEESGSAEPSQSECPTCWSDKREVRKRLYHPTEDVECFDSWHDGESGPAEPRVFQQTNCPKCRHRFTVEVLGVENDAALRSEVTRLQAELEHCEMLIREMKSAAVKDQKWYETELQKRSER